MPRKGVPGIDGCLCEIKEKLKALYDRTHACILRINGKTPDGNGDITLDLSDAIPGRYVESVNGEDGNVIIDKAAIGLSHVDNISSSMILNLADANNQSRLDAFEAAKLDPVELEVTANSGRIIQLEGQQVVLDDKMEQTIQYVDAIGDDVAEIKDTYVDKTTTQYITGKKYVPTAGAGDDEGMIANVDYVSRTDPATRQNNLLHTLGDETATGTKTFTNLIVGGFKHLLNGPSSNWKRLYTRTNNNLTQILMFVGGSTIGFATIGSTTVQTHILSSSARPYPQPIFKLCIGTDGETSLHMKGQYSASTHVYLLSNFRYGTDYDITEGIRIDNKDESEPIVGKDYTTVYDSVDFGVVR